MHVANRRTWPRRVHATYFLTLPDKKHIVYHHSAVRCRTKKPSSIMRTREYIPLIPRQTPAPSARWPGALALCPGAGRCGAVNANRNRVPPPPPPLRRRRPYWHPDQGGWRQRGKQRSAAKTRQADGGVYRPTAPHIHMRSDETKHEANYRRARWAGKMEFQTAIRRRPKVRLG